MNNTLGIRVTTGSLLRYSLPTIVSMLFMNVYIMTDGIFVARLISTTALSAVNIVMPLTMASVALGMMLATGGSALVARKMGEGKEREARADFSQIALVAVLSGVVLSALGLVFIHPVLRFLGASGAVYPYCYDYAFVSLLLFPFGMLATLFQVFFVTAGKATLGMVVTIVGGVVSVSLDYICIAVLDMGIAGAAVSTGVGYAVPGLVGFAYFLFNRKGPLYLVKPRADNSVLVQTCVNGSSEMVTNLSQSVVIVLFNNILMRLVGENGVASVTIVMYAQALLNSAFMGYSTGIAPIISYNYGRPHHKNLKRIHIISRRAICLSAIAVFAAAMVFAGPLVAVFTPVETPVYAMAKQGFRLFAFSFLFMGFSIYGSSLFTALSNGRVSAIISFMRTLVFVVIAALGLPALFGLNGVWIAVPVAEAFGLAVTLHYVRKHKTTYRYL